MILEISIIILIISYVIWDVLRKTELPDLTDKHVVVTGGSSGIGLAVAIELAKKGAHVTIIARDPSKLHQAETTLLCTINSKAQKIKKLSMDVTQSYEVTEAQLIELENEMGPVYMLVNCAGQAVCSTIADDTEANLRRMVDLNLFGTVFPTKALSKRMALRKEGFIVITASQGCLLGIYGLGAYCASKWALRGFAETLYNEMAVHNVSVTLCLPPDTDTPGFIEENKGKLEETKLICSSGGIVSPTDVAQKLLSDAFRRRFWSTTGVGNFLITSSAGISPPTSWQEAFMQITFGSLMRMFGAIFALQMQKTIRFVHNKRQAIEAAKKAE